MDTYKDNKKQSILTQHPEIKLNKKFIFEERDVSMRKTKIVCTLGPSSRTVDDLVALLDAGMSIARLNFSHGTHDYHRETVKNFREALKQRPKLICGLMLDTKGPEIRTGYCADEKGIELIKGQTLDITTDYTHKGTAEKIAISYKSITKIQKGQTILMADGNLVCKVTDLKPDGVVVTVMNDYLLGNTKNVNLPNVVVDLPTLTDKDEDDLIDFGLKEGIDFVAASFVRKAEDLENIRDVLGPKGAHIKIISKIENREGLDNYEEILEASDGIMVARGDLGMELPVEKVFIAQKYMIDKANIAAKPIITATQMLESMGKNPRPTRAEATDVANAVLDGSDCVMLSGETANGLFPIKAVETMSKICVEAEACINYSNVFDMMTHYTEKTKSVDESVCVASVSTAKDIEAKLIIVITENGHTARLIAKYRPMQPILALCMSSSVIRQLNVVRGVFCLKIPSFIGSENLLHNAIKFATENEYVNKGDSVVCIMGQSEQTADHVNIMKVRTIQ